MLNPTQLAILKTAIAADGVLNALPNSGDGNAQIAYAYNALASPNFFVWNPSVSVNDITDAIIWANMTPAQPIPTTPQLDVAVWSAKALLCQGKQFNLQNLLIGRNTIDASRVNIRAAFADCLTGLPSTITGANQAAGWAAVQVAMSRKATRGESLFASKVAGDGSTAQTSATMVVIGEISTQDIDSARNLP